MYKKRQREIDMPKQLSKGIPEMAHMMGGEDTVLWYRDARIVIMMGKTRHNSEILFYEADFSDRKI